MAKKKKKNTRFQRHFRKFRNGKLTGHPQYVYGENGKKYLIIGLTESPTTNGVDNIPLYENPEPNNKTPAFIRPTPDSVDKGVNNTKMKGWKFGQKDKQKVQDVIDGKYKKKPSKK